MARVKFSLEQQLQDRRSNEVAYQLTIQNNGELPVDLLSLAEQVPEEVEVAETRNPSVAAAKRRYITLCSELSQLIENELLVSSEDFRQRFIRTTRDVISKIYSLSGILRLTVSMLTGKLAESMESRLVKGKALRFEVHSHRDAQDAFNRFFEQADQSIRNIYEAKLTQLANLEADAGPEIESATIATIEPDSVLRITYVLRFPRKKLEGRKYNFSIEGTYSEGSEAKQFTKSTSASLIVSPDPWVLSGIAVFSSYLGVVLRSAVVAQTNATSAASWFEPLAALAQPETWAAAILALVFFNVYEYTSAGQKITMPLGWRSALLVGVLCGIGGDRILAAMEAFLK